MTQASENLSALDLSKELGVSHASILKWLKAGKVTTSKLVFHNGRTRYEVKPTYRIRLPYSEAVLERAVPE